MMMMIMMRSFLLVSFLSLASAADVAAACPGLPPALDGTACVTEETLQTCTRLVEDEGCTNLLWMVASCPLLVTCGGYGHVNHDASGGNLRASSGT
jgi:hypothetical protein